MTLDNAILICERSMLDSEPSGMEEPSEAERGGVSPPELEVHVLGRERDAGPGLVKTGAGQSTRGLDTEVGDGLTAYTGRTCPPHPQ